MGIIGGILLIFVLLAIPAFLMPVKIHFYAAGGTDEGFDVTGKVMIYSGLVGCGFRHCRKQYRLHFFIHSWKAIDADITSIIAYFRRNEKKKSVETRKKVKAKKIEEKKPLFERLKTFYQKAYIYRGYFKDGYRAFREIIRFDRFYVNIILGLGKPAATGQIIGIICALNSILPENCRITSRCNFTRQVLQGDVSIAITIISLQFWKNTIRYIPVFWRTYIKHKERTDTLTVQEV
jgi:hypothetical protein